MALRTLASLASTALWSFSKSNVFTSQSARSNTMLAAVWVAKIVCRLRPGASPVIQSPHPPGPVSAPGRKPGASTRPSRPRTPA